MGAILFAIVLLLCSSPSFAQTTGGEFVAQPLCAPYKNPALRASAEAMCGGKLIDAFANLANQTFSLSKPLSIVAAECGQSNAFYDRKKMTIFICYELNEEIFYRIVREVEPDRNTQTQMAAGAMSFVFLHELGHAVIDQYNLPVLGREEDAADQVATLLLIAMAANKAEVARFWTVGAHWYFNKRKFFISRSHFADEHSVNPQRQFNIACWIYGSDPNKYAALARYAKLPESRAQRCAGEYQQMMNAANQMLSQYVKHPNIPVQSSGNQGQGTSMAQRAAICHDDAKSRNLVGYQRENFIAECYKSGGVVLKR